jgi:prepilin-type N-terminal cleavage/methylation domain-containing protein
MGPNAKAGRAARAGFSLIEMMVVVAIILILGAIAAPSLWRAIRRYQIESDARNISGILMTARYEAIKRQERICTIFVAPDLDEGRGPKYGIDLDADGALEDTSDDDPREPSIIASRVVNFFRDNVATLPPDDSIDTLPEDYQGVELAPDYSICFSATGTVVTDPDGTGVWNLAANVQGFAFLRGDPNATADIDAWFVIVTPAGRIRLFTWQSDKWASV